MKYAVINSNNIVVNVIELTPDNICTGHESGIVCMKWHVDPGFTIEAVKDVPNTNDPIIRPANIGDSKVASIGFVSSKTMSLLDPNNITKNTIDIALKVLSTEGDSPPPIPSGSSLQVTNV